MNDNITYKAIALVVVCSVAFIAGFVFRGDDGGDNQAKLLLSKLKEFLNVSSIAGIASVALYIVCLALPAYMPIVDGRPGDEYLGLAALIFGPFGLLALHFSWLANLCLWFSWSRLWLERKEAAMAWSFGSLILALSFLLHDKIPVWSSGIFPFKILVGYYVWMSSIVCALIAAFVAPYAKAQAENAS